MGYASHAGEQSMDRFPTWSQIQAQYPDYNPDPWSDGTMPEADDDGEGV